MDNYNTWEELRNKFMKICNTKSFSLCVKHVLVILLIFKVNGINLLLGVFICCIGCIDSMG